MVWRKSYTLLTWGLIIGIVSGDIIGYILMKTLPDSPVKSLVLNNVHIGFSPVTFDFIVLKFTIGLSFAFNLLTVIFIIIALYVFYRL